VANRALSNIVFFPPEMTMKVYGDEECIFHLYFYEDLLTSKVLYPQRKILILIDISREDEHPEIHIYFFFINFDQIKIIYKGNKSARAHIYIYIYIYRERERERERLSKSKLARELN
jgi:hypothetical protein